MTKKKNETKTVPVSNKDTVKDSKQTSTKKPDTQANIGKSDSGAGKGDKLRRGITQNEWEKKWEAIFRKKESTVVVDKGSTNEPEGTA